jgi:hypothetical protein
MVNPEPMADFLDLAVVGEADQVIHQVVDILIQNKEEAWERPALYERASEIEGIYCPSLFQPIYEGGRLKSEIKAAQPGYRGVKRAMIPNLEAQPLPNNWVMPALKPVHDRLGLEAARGCTRGCRFCQAGYMYRPVRERSAQTLYGGAPSGYRSPASRSWLCCPSPPGIIPASRSWPAGSWTPLSQRVGLSLPSLRMDSLTGELGPSGKAGCARPVSPWPRRQAPSGCGT